MPTQTVRARQPQSAALVAPAPIVKWVGGKSKLLEQLAPLLPPGAELMRHVEPFVGGGALFFARQPGRALLADINPALIATYETVRDQVDGVLSHLRKLARVHDTDRYYRVRARYNTARDASLAERAAMFLYLNKTCFNGLHRVNKKGHFNVPVGRYVNPRIFDEDLLRAVSRSLARVELCCDHFTMLLSRARPGDFVYLDPPYEPVSRTANFTSYTQGGFSRDDQTLLCDVFAELDRRGCKLMLSNSDVPFIRQLYRRYRIDVVTAARAVNCDARSRGKVAELVVRNY